MPLTHLTLDELRQHAAVKPDDPELVAEVMARFTAGGIISAEEVEKLVEAGREAAREEENDVAYQAGWDAGVEEGFNRASGRIE